MKSRHNRTLIVIILFAIVTIGFMYWQYQEMFNTNSEKSSFQLTEYNDDQQSEGESHSEGVTQDDLGIPLADDTSMQNTEAQKIFSWINKDLYDCLGINSTNLPESIPLTSDAVVMSIQSELGPSHSSVDHWMNWHLRARDGQEKRIRLEITENDDGKITRELKYFILDKEDLPVPVELDKQKAINPTDTAIEQMLGEGEVFYKEKAAAIYFPGNERFEYIERNGLLSEFEFYRGDRFFRCQNIKSRESCQCVR